MAIMIHDI